MSRKLVNETEDAQTDLPHRAGGWPDFKGWPGSQSIQHQQLHVSWLHRAWEGGLRVLVASTVETEAVALGWRQPDNAEGHFDPAAQIVKPIPGFDLRSALRQIDFIKALAKANSEWMKVVLSPEEAEQTVADGGLAVILSAEMDALGLADMEQLYDAGVRHAIPIHLANSAAFGGNAVYGDFFNANTRFQTDRFYEVQPGSDPHVAFQLSAQTPYLAPWINGGPLDGGGWRHPRIALALPQTVQHPDYCRLGYQLCPEQGGADGGVIDLRLGQKNALGLAEGGAPIKALMKLGLLVDVAHMGDLSTEQELALAGAVDGGYPILDSHTDLANADGGWRSSVRDLRRDLAQQILDGGGVIGLGTGPHTNPELIGHWAGAPLVDLSEGHPVFLEALRQRPTDERGGHLQLEVRVWTGPEVPKHGRFLVGAKSLQRGVNAVLTLQVAERRGQRRLLSFLLAHEAPLLQGEPTVWRLALPPHLRVEQIEGVGLTKQPGGSWDVEGLTVGTLDASGGAPRPLLSRFGRPLATLSDAEPTWSTTLLPLGRLPGADVERDRAGHHRRRRPQSGQQRQCRHRVAYLAEVAGARAGGELRRGGARRPRRAQAPAAEAQSQEAKVLWRADRRPAGAAAGRARGNSLNRGVPLQRWPRPRRLRPSTCRGAFGCATSIRSTSPPGSRRWP